MMRPLFFILLLSLPALADPPKFSSGGVIFGVQYGPGLWSFDRGFIGSQVGQGFADAYIGDLRGWPDAQTLAIRLGYNILGHASIEVNLLATGWALSEPSRGGGGFLTGILAWHPLQIVFMNKEKRPIPIDFSIFFGAGYGIVGQRLGMDGLVWQWGMTVDYWFNRFIGLGAFVRGTFPRFGAMYLDYDNRSAAGNTLQLPQTSGGMFWHPGLELLLRFGD